jgi:hypothetical protein
LIELSLILNSRQFEAVDFFVLAQQRFTGRTEYRIPQEAAEMGTMLGRVMCGLAGRDLMQPKGLPADCGGQKYEQKSSICFTLHEVCLKFFTACCRRLF